MTTTENPLQELYDLYREDPRHWVQDAYTVFRDFNGEGVQCYCLVGGINKVLGYLAAAPIRAEDQVQAVEAVGDAIVKLMPNKRKAFDRAREAGVSADFVIGWNDVSSRKIGDVMAVLEIAVAKETR